MTNDLNINTGFCADYNQNKYKSKYKKNMFPT